MLVRNVSVDGRSSQGSESRLSSWPDSLPAELSVLVSCHGASVRQTAYRVTRSDGAAEEIAQEVFLRAWTRGGFDPARCTVEGWLRLLAHGMAVDWVRREAAHQRRLIHAGPMYSVGQAPVVEDDVTDRDRARVIRAAVAELPVAERQAVALAYFAGLTYREVAERLGRPEGTVKSQIRRALTRLARTVDVTVARDVVATA